jgi:hypothetical protein
MNHIVHVLLFVYFRLTRPSASQRVGLKLFQLHKRKVMWAFPITSLPLSLFLHHIYAVTFSKFFHSETTRTVWNKVRLNHPTWVLLKNNSFCWDLGGKYNKCFFLRKFCADETATLNEWSLHGGLIFISILCQ